MSENNARATFHSVATSYLLGVLADVGNVVGSISIAPRSEGDVGHCVREDLLPCVEVG